MGTNFYLQRKKPTLRETIHIGKQSFGWAMHWDSCDEQNWPRWCDEDHSRMYRDGRKIPYMHFVKRCKVCGRIGDVKIKAGVHEPPEDMSFYVVPSWMYLWTEKTLSEEMRVR